MKTYYIKADSMKDAIDKYKSLRSKANRRDDDEEIKSALSEPDWDEDDFSFEPSADARGTKAEEADWSDIEEDEGKHDVSVDGDEDNIDVTPVDEDGNDVVDDDKIESADDEPKSEEDEPIAEKNPRVDELCEAIMNNAQFECESAVVVGPNKVECVGGPMTSDCPEGTKWYAVIDSDGSIMTYVECNEMMKDFSVYSPEEAEKQFFGE